MLKTKRQRLITQKLENDGILNVSDLSTLFQCTEETIRRDLKELEKNNKLVRTHGGAFSSDYAKSVPFATRESLFIKEKTAMAYRAEEFIKDNAFIILDASSTCLQIATVLFNSNKHVSILTNSLRICNLFANTSDSFVVACTGGHYCTSTASFHGPATISSIQHYYADIAFISCSKISKDYGLSDSNEEEAEIRKTMLMQAKIKVLVADHTKFHEIASHLFFLLKDIDILITDDPLDNEWEDFLQNSNIQLIYM